MEMTSESADVREETSDFGHVKKVNNEMEIIKVEDSKQFIETFNDNKISKEYLLKCKKSAILFYKEEAKLVKKLINN